MVLRQTAKIKLLPSFCSSLNSRVKIFVFVANSERHLFLFLCDLMKDQKKRTQIERSSLPFDVRPRNVKLNPSTDTPHLSEILYIITKEFALICRSV